MKSLQKFIIFLTIITLTFCPDAVLASTNFLTCLSNVQNGTFGIGADIGGTDNHGNPVNVSDATALTYNLCVTACGSGQEPFVWTIFSQQFTAWLLPWLALLSQLPFGADDKRINLKAVLLTLGSPMLAAYSLAITVLNGRWIKQRFDTYNYPNSQQVMRILRSLQQAPFEIDEKILASLVVLHQNDKWWSDLIKQMDQFTHTWSISAATSIGWVVIAYIFTIIDSFSGSLTDFLEVNGQGVGSLWLWLLPIVIGWLQISPKCNEKRLIDIFEHANNVAHIATDEGVVLAQDAKTESQAFQLTIKGVDHLRQDAKYTTPIYNYARLLPWVQAVEKVSMAFECATEHVRKRESVNRAIPWGTVGDRKPKPLDRCREGNTTEVEEYCKLQPQQNWGIKDSGVVYRMFMASFVALLLQWGTAGGAIVVQWYTPTQGLGCRSASYLLYAVLSTTVWMLLVTSSILTHYYTTATSEAAMQSTHYYTPATEDEDEDRPTYPPHRVHSPPTPLLPTSAPHATQSSSLRWSKAETAKQVSIIFRSLGNFIARFNAIWIILICVLQFGGFYDRCYCNSSVFWLRNNAYNVVTLTASELASIKSVWGGGVCLSAIPTVFYFVFINLYIQPSLPKAEAIN